MNHRILKSLPTPITHCPDFCHEHIAELHFGATHYFVDHHSGFDQGLVAQLLLVAEPGEEPDYSVTLAAREPGARLLGEIHPDFPLSPSAARWLGETLIKLADQADAAEKLLSRPVLDKINRPTWSGPTLVCMDCGAEVAVDSTPDLDRCWIDAERADFEVDR